MSVKEGLLYTKEHEWAKVDGEEATCGITHHAQEALGDITFVELPAVAATIKQGEAFSSIESVKAASDIYAPLSGEVIKINEQLESSPDLINSSPYEEGWLAVIKVADMAEKDSLMSAQEYQEYLKSQEK